MTTAPASTIAQHDEARREALRRLDALSAMIGRTPLVEIRMLFRGRPRRIFAKYEQRSFTGSVKDRMAMWILRAAYQTGELRAGDTIAEATSGNTGIAFAALGRALGHPVRIYMPDWMSRERVALTESLGAEIVPVSREEGGFRASISLADEFARQRGRVFLPHQFANPANVLAHQATTGPEIERQLESIGLVADAFVAGVGTGGTVMGVGRYLNRCRETGEVHCSGSEAPCDDLARVREDCRETNDGKAKCDRRHVRIHPLEPAESPTLRAGRKVGQHRIQGISDEFVPSILKLDEIDPVIDVHDGDAILMAQALARSGLAVGISSGANTLGALKILDELGEDAVVVTILPDSNKKYLSTDLFRREPARDHYLAPSVADIRWTAIPCPPREPQGASACGCGLGH